MSAVEYRFRIEVTCQAKDGSWHVMAWTQSDDEGNRHEASCLWVKPAGEALRVWRQLEAGQVPKDLQGSLDGWGGVHVSGVQQWRRFRRAEGWSPWERHVEAVEGTRDIRSGSLAMPDREVA